MKIGLVTPYIYPLPGGVNEHVRYLYENLRLRGHDVRIISSSHGPQRACEGDVIRLGNGFCDADQRLGRDAHGLAALRRPRRRDARARAVRRAPLPRAVRAVPVADPAPRVAQRQHRHVPRLRRLDARRTSSAARVMQGHARRLHGRIAVSAAARHFIDRYFPGDYKVIPNGVDLDRYRKRGPDRALAGRHAQHPVRRPLRAAQGPARTCSRPTGSCARPAVDCRLLIVGAGPQEREARRYIATRRLAGVEFLGRVSDAEKAQLFRTADVYVSPATGRESFGIVLLEAMAAGAPIVAADIHGYKGVVRRGEQALLVPPREPRELAAAIVAARSSTTGCGPR